MSQLSRLKKIVNKILILMMKEKYLIDFDIEDYIESEM
jgi:hypothetical protein